MRDSEYTMVFGTSLITASPPHISPYSVQYPTASSLLLPVVSTSAPVLFESAISVTPRSRDCRFSSVTSGARPANSGASSFEKPFVHAADGNHSKRIPSCRRHLARVGHAVIG